MSRENIDSGSSRVNIGKICMKKKNKQENYFEVLKKCFFTKSMLKAHCKKKNCKELRQNTVRKEVNGNR